MQMQLSMQSLQQQQPQISMQTLNRMRHPWNHYVHGIPTLQPLLQQPLLQPTANLHPHVFNVARAHADTQYPVPPAYQHRHPLLNNNRPSQTIVMPPHHTTNMMPPQHGPHHHTNSTARRERITTPPTAMQMPVQKTPVVQSLYQTRPLVDHRPQPVPHSNQPRGQKEEDVPCDEPTTEPTPGRAAMPHRDTTKPCNMSGSHSTAKPTQYQMMVVDLSKSSRCNETTVPKQISTDGNPQNGTPVLSPETRRSIIPPVLPSHCGMEQGTDQDFLGYRMPQARDT